jgi:NAD(P)-dependent dehydrogenase (short-subunit alcohol dehydrogenase family)
MKDLVGKVAVVTGGASGIGRAMAERFLAEGMKVVLADVEDDALASAVATLSSDGAPVVGQRTDVSDVASLERLAERTVEEFGRVDVLCNNAGVDTGGSFLGIAESGWRWVMDVNFYGVLNGCRIFLPLWAQQEEAHIVNTGSVASLPLGDTHDDPVLRVQVRCPRSDRVPGHRTQDGGQPGEGVSAGAGSGQDPHVAG